MSKATVAGKHQLRAAELTIGINEIEGGEGGREKGRREGG